MTWAVFKGLDYLAVGLGWRLDNRNKTGKLWRISRGAPFHILVDKFGYNVICDEPREATILYNPKDGSFVVLKACLFFRDKSSYTEDFLCDKVRAEAYGLNKLVA